jgi:hypothetical protein
MTLSRKEQVKGTFDSAKARIAASAVAALIAFGSPLLENRAFAQAPAPAPTEVAAPAPVQDAKPAPDACAPPSCEVKAEIAMMSDGKANPKVFTVVRPSTESAGKLFTLEVDGPATVTLQFYPAVLTSRFKTNDTTVDKKIEYSVGPVGSDAVAQSFEGVTRQSEFKSPDMAEGLSVGTPLTFTVKLPKGRNVIRHVSPNGFMEVVSVVPVVEEQKPVAATQPAATQPAKTLVAADTNQPGSVAIDIYGEHQWLRDFGDSKNSGMLTDASLLFRRNWSNVGLYGGVLGTSYQMALDAPSALSTLRMTSVDGELGLSLHFGAHTIKAGGIAGLRMIDRSMTPKVAILSPFEGGMAYDFEFGGKASYDFNRMLGLIVRGSNNPFNPLTGQAYFIFPVGWAPDNANPELSFLFRWMHALQPGDDAKVGGFNLNENNYLMHINTKIPVWKIGPFVPSVMADLELDKAPSKTTALFYVGGLLGVRTNTFRIDAGAAANVADGKPLILLRMGYDPF